jgi:hypothetical protein
MAALICQYARFGRQFSNQINNTICYTRNYAVVMPTFFRNHQNMKVQVSSGVYWDNWGILGYIGITGVMTSGRQHTVIMPNGTITRKGLRGNN